MKYIVFNCVEAPVIIALGTICINLIVPKGIFLKYFTKGNLDYSDIKIYGKCLMV